jgi:hypothetical protein
MQVPYDVVFCPNSSAQVEIATLKVSIPIATAPLIKKKKNATLAAALSILLAGLGHFYLGEWKRGGLWLSGAIALAIILFLRATTGKLPWMDYPHTQCLRCKKNSPGKICLALTDLMQPAKK